MEEKIILGCHKKKICHSFVFSFKDNKMYKI